MSQVVMYTTAVCPFCVNAKRLLDSKGVKVKEIRVDREPHLRQKMMAESGERTVPQIWIGDRHVGGFTELWALDKRGELDPLLFAK
ncbi:glutaredoxin 3 [Gilvimarinus agarilyticus]|uniref:glutaredoxin 3 n=1 Tax=unclassified Gilvimarinus TaxID=2642066 RepID=UPI001C09C821|nr:MULTISPECIES: glutaredoxin 3 [unclassified Gilvimarinus]MBU2885804.1 glutaredoxin 3 [Gilvimarinus agarilyticus]MDO6570658.1 glutaredoxin 3 [Gilvimarinus sp. 2_MG-2023]MDO6746677.1 glutaredoxin 3 [Gilvimarinus sp. 1_MG-2023]